MKFKKGDIIQSYGYYHWYVDFFDNDNYYLIKLFYMGYVGDKPMKFCKDNIDNDTILLTSIFREDENEI